MLTKPPLQYPFAPDEKKRTARYLMHPVSEALQDCNELSRYCRRCVRAPLTTQPHDTELLAYPIMLHPLCKYFFAGGCASAFRSSQNLLWATWDLVVLTQWPKAERASFSPHPRLYPSRVPSSSPSSSRDGVFTEAQLSRDLLIRGYIHKHPWQQFLH